ncbi:MAG: hypothetical protein IT440_05725 [Phycisphaeraceae bacterium]|nr:hypothetical protein [Phycisphaeraceae bacterium]
MPALSRADPKLESSGSNAGFGFAAGERWGMTQVTASNPDAQAHTVLAAVSFTKATDIGNVQFARTVWLPPHSVRRLDLPFRAPEMPGKTQSVPIQSLLLDTQGATERTLSREDGLMRAEQRTPVIVSLSGGDESGSDLAHAVKALCGQDTAMAGLRSQQLPPFAAAWQGIDLLILSDPELQLDAAQKLALRQWLTSGGRLWILLDRVGDEIARDLLGDDYRCATVGRTRKMETDLEPGTGVVLRDVIGSGGLGTVKAKETWPAGWTVSGGAEHVEVKSGFTTVKRDQAAGDATLRQSFKLDPLWSKVRLTVRASATLTAPASGDHGAKARFQFISDAGQPVGSPIALGAAATVKAVTEFAQTVPVPAHAAMVQVDFGLWNAAGEAAFHQVMMTPMGLRFPDPVEMAQVVADGVDVDRMVGGWPAAFHMPVGLGTVMITTLSPRLWTAEQDAGLGTLDDVVRVIARRRMKAALTMENWSPMVHQAIGYRVFQRGPVLSLLAAYVAALLAGGVWLWRKNQLEWLSAWGAGLAVVLALGLMALGVKHRGLTPLTIADAQFIEVVPSQQMATITGLVGVYSPAGGVGPLSATAGGVLWPDRTGQEGRLLRMVWSDVDRWTWDFLQLPAGAVRMSELKHAAPLPQPATVTLTVGEKGVEGQVDWPTMPGFEDPVLAGVNGSLVVKPRGDGRFVCSSDDRLPPGQFIGGQSLSATQTMRQQVYRDLLLAPAGFDRAHFPVQPVLLWWARPMDLGFALPQQAERRETGLVAVPVRIETPKPGTKLRIPSPLIRIDAVRNSAFSSVTVFNNLNQQWIGQMTQGAVAPLQFTVPGELVPLKLDSALLLIHIHAPSRLVEVLDGKNNVLAAFNRPLRPVSVELKPSDTVKLDEHGALQLTLRISDGDNVPWEITGMDLDVTATAEAK